MNINIGELIEQQVLEQVQLCLDDALSEKIKNTVQEYVQKYLDNLTDDALFHGNTNLSAAKVIRDYTNRYLSNEIGNRLRCGCYDHTLFKKVFDENFDSGFKAQIKSEVQSVISKEIKTIAKEELNKMLNSIKN